VAKARCERCGMPNGRDHTYSAQPYLPVGYPNSSVICGRTDCRNPAFAWLTLDEERQYRDKVLQRIEDTEAAILERSRRLSESPAPSEKEQGGIDRALYILSLLRAKAGD
jgi:hypothetical protein